MDDSNEADIGKPLGNRKILLAKKYEIIKSFFLTIKPWLMVSTATSLTV